MPIFVQLGCQKLKGQKVGYIRVSSVEQNTGRQLEGIEVDRSFVDRASGKNTDRPKFQEMLNYVREGDRVIVHSMDRFARSLKDLVTEVDKLVKRGIAIQFVKENITFTAQSTPMDNLMLLFIRSIQNSFADGNVQGAFGRFLSPKSIEQFTAEDIAKGLSGDALWKDVINSASKYTSTSAFGCFAAGTLVHTDQGLVPIQDIKVGDMVLAKPESGEDETSYKPVLNTFVHENKELWLVVAKKHWNSHGINDIWIPSKEHRRIAKQSEFIATPNHPVWVVGMGVPDDKEQIESITMYPQPHWKRVDQLQQHEAIVNKDGMIFCIERAQPLYQFQNELVEDKPSYMWYQDYYSDIRSYKNVAEFEDSEEAKDYFNHDYEEYLKNEANKAEIGWVRDINNYYEIGSLGLSINDTNGIAWHRNTRKDINGLNIPFSNTVYNIEVEDDHTYFVTRAGIWVHNTNCEKAKEILLGNLKDKDGFTQIKTSKDDFSKDITRACPQFILQ